MKKLQQTKSFQKTPLIHHNLNQDSIKASPKPVTSFQIPKETTKGMRVQSPAIHCQSPKIAFFQQKTPNKVQEVTIKSPTGLVVKQKNVFNIDMSQDKPNIQGNGQIMQMQRQQAKLKGVVAKSPIKKVDINPKRLSVQPRGLNGSQDKKPYTRLSYKLYPDKMVKTEAEDQETSIRYSVLETDYDEQYFNTTMNIQENANTSTIGNDSNVRAVKEISMVTPGKKDEKKSPQLEAKTIKRNLKQDFSPNQQKKDDRPAWGQREGSVQKRCVTSPGDAAEKKKKMSPVVKAYCVNHPTRNAVYRGKGGFNCCQDCLNLLNQHSQTNLVPNDKSPGKTPKKTLEYTVKRDEQAERIEQNKRKEEFVFYIKDLEENLLDIPKIREELSNEYRQREDTIEDIKEQLRAFGEKVIEVVHEQVENSIINLEKEFVSGMNEIRQANRTLENCKDQIFQVKKYMEKNMNTILQNPRSENVKLKDKYEEACASLHETVKDIQILLSQPIKVIPTEKVSIFKKTLKTAVNDIFSRGCIEDNLNNQPLPEMKNLGEFEKFLKSEESEDALKIKPVKEKPNTNIIISFDNKEIFQNALQVSTKGVTQASIQENQTGNTQMNLFRTDSDDFSTMIFSGAHGTPRLHCESEFEYEEMHMGEHEGTGNFDDFLGSNGSDGVDDEEIANEQEDGKLNKFVHLLNKVNQKQNSRNDYLKAGRKASQIEGYEDFMNYLENKLKDEGIRETSFQKSLFQSPQFKEV